MQERAPVATESQRVANGTVDTADNYPAVVALGDCPKFDFYCSGTLVSEARVMTAAHCTDHVGESVNVCIVTHPGGVKTAQTVPATVTRRFGYIKGSLEDKGLDIAILDLGQLVMTPKPIPVAEADSPCPANFDNGTLVGFGHSGDQPGGPFEGQCGLVQTNDRSHATSDEWELKTPSALSGTYENTWNLTGYEGVEHGDSGGALLHGGKLCGISHGWTGTTCSPYLGAINATAIAAAPQELSIGVSADGQTTTPEQAIYYFDPRTSEKARIGSCPPSYFDLDGADKAQAEVDSDVDDMPDLCDTCPGLANPEQFTSIEPDKDEDGIPDKCDSCPSVATYAPPGVAQMLAPLYPEADFDKDGVGDSCDWCAVPGKENNSYAQALTNCNLEAELNVHYPGKFKPPVIKLGPNYASEIATYKAAFKIGTCERSPCPLMSRHEGAWPPGQETQLKCMPPPGGSCHWSVQNAIFYQPTPSLSTKNGLATTRTKWCHCPDQNVSWVNGRAKCQLTWDCRGTAATFDKPQWFDIYAARLTPLGLDWSTMGLSEYGQIFDGTGHPQTYWNYRALPSPLVRDKSTGSSFVEGVGEPVDAFVNGVLWADTREGFGIPPGSPAEDDLRDRGSAFESGRAEVVVAGTMPIVGFVNPFWDMPVPCWDCPLGMGSFLVLPQLLLDGALVPQVVAPGGARPMALFTADAVSKLLATRAPSSGQRYFPSAEPLGLVEGSDGTLRGLRGAILDTSNGNPITLLVSPSLFEPIFAQPLVRRGGGVALASAQAAVSPEPGPLGSDEGIVVSGRRGEIYRFGGAGTLPERAWTFSLAWHSWVPRVLDPGARPGRIVAATYRAADDRVHTADRGAVGQSIWLRRWKPGSSAFELLAKWPAAWSSLDRYWLVSSEGGDLLFIGSGMAFSIVVRLGVDESGKVVCHGVSKLQSTILDRPNANRDGVSVTVPSSGGFTQIVIGYGDLGSVPKGWCPGDKP